MIYIIALLFPLQAGAQGISQKLPADHIIGTLISVDYDNNNEESTTVNTIANVFDGNFSTYFASYERSGTWVGLDLGEKHVITKVAYCPRQGMPQRLQLGVIEGANHPDFGDAIVLYLIRDTPPENKMTEQTINCSRGFRYVRYVGPNDVRCNIAGLEFWGYAGEGDDSGLFQTTNLPDVIIHTTDAAEIDSRDVYLQGIVSFISGNGTEIYTDSLDIRGRGNASWEQFPKKPYRMRLYNKTNVLGLPAKEKNWTLINNFGDKTLMRNLLAFDLSRRFQMPYTASGIPVNVYVNGEYKGCYQLCDHVEVAAHRVEVQELTPDDVNLPNLSGGYLIEMDAYAYKEIWKFNSQRGIPVRTKYPNDANMTYTQFNYIQSHFNQMEAAVYSANYTDPANGYRKYLDTETFIRYFLVGEISGNTDTYWQTNLYKKRNDDKFYSGPVWDFDLAYENDSRTYPINNNSDWIYASSGSVAGTARNMVNRLLSDPDFFRQLKSIYARYRDQQLITEEILSEVVDHYANLINESQNLNFLRWNILNSKVHMNPTTYGSYAGEVENVKRYIRNRIVWMDKKLSYTPAPPPPPPPITSADENNLNDISVRAFAGNIFIEGVVNSTLTDIFNVTGSRLYSKTISGDTKIPLPEGIYIVRLIDSSGNIKTVKCSL